MILKKLVVLLIVLGPVLVFSQSIDQNYDPNLLTESLPKTPEAGNLGEYGDISNNPYTGKANVSIPIHAIDFDGLQIPIQLSYDTGGVRVASEASWVGLNWSLAPHVGITRTINGSDDINLNRIPNSTGAISAFPFNHAFTVSSIFPYIGQQDVIDIHTSFGDHNLFNNPRSYADMQPDIFEVSVFGRSYTFRFEKRVGASNTLNTHIFNSNLAVITYDLNNRSFTLIDESGFEFYFSTKDYSTTFSSSSSENNPSSSVRESTLAQTMDDPNGLDRSTTTSWLLNKITSPYGNELNFNYKQGIYASQPNYSGSVKVDEQALIIENDAYLPPSYLSPAQYTSSISIIETNYLESIIGDFGTIDFISDERKDLMTGSDLREYPGLFAHQFLLGYHDGVIDGVNLRNFSWRHGTSQENVINYTTYKLNQIKIEDYNGTVVKEVDLYNSYFNNDKQGIIENQAMLEAKYLRLKLDSVQVNDKNYKFSYEQPNSLPSKLTDDVDFWGFYNGANNTTNVPSIGRFVTGWTGGVSATGLLDNVLAHRYFNYNGASRRSNFTYGKRGLLKTISYPTGGYTELEYEAHDAVIEVTQPYHVTHYMPTGRIQWTNLHDEDLYNFTYLYLKNANDPSFDFYDREVDENSNPNGSGSTIGTPGCNTCFNTSVPVIIKVEANLYIPTGLDCLDGWAGYPRYIIQDKIDPNISYTVFSYDDFPADGSVTPVTKNVFVPPGEYELKYVNYYPNPPGTECGFPAVLNPYPPTITLYDDFSNGDYLEHFEIGGARVKKITNYSNDASFVSSKEFDYNIPNITNPNYSSSGKLMDDLTFFSKTFGYYSYSPRMCGLGGALTLNSSSAIRQSPSAQGSHIGYTMVSEKSVDANGNSLGHIERTYENVTNSYYKESFNRVFGYASTHGAIPYVSIENTLLTGMSPRVDWGHSNGNVLSERVFNRTGELLKLTVNDYNPININPDYTYYANFQGAGYTNSGNPNTTWNNYFNNAETFTVYQLNSNESKKSVLISSHVVDYYEDGLQLYSDTYNLYDTTSGDLITSEVELGDNDVLKSHYYYAYAPEVSGLPHVSTLINENRYATLIKNESYRNNLKLGEQLVTYGNFAGNIMPSKSSYKKGEETNYVDHLFYQRYDTDGNVLQAQQGEGGLVTSYIWGYNNQYIVAKVDNATYQQIENLSNFGNSFTIAENLSSSQESQLRSLPGAIVTTYTYKPLVGLLSSKDTRGIVQSFEYDQENRLERIRDDDNNIVAEYEYNYNSEGGVTADTETTPTDDEPSGGDILFSRSSVSVNNTTYDALTSSISMSETQGNGTNFTFDYTANASGGTGNYSYRWKVRGQEFSSFSTSNALTINFDCSVEDVRGLEVICEVIDDQLKVTHRSIIKHVVYCNN